MAKKPAYEELEQRVKELEEEAVVHKQAMEMLSDSEKRFRITAEETGQLLYSFDPKTGKVKWTGAVEAVTGYTYEEYQSFDVDVWAEQIHPDDREMVIKAMDEAVEHQTRSYAEYRFRCKDGSYIFVEEHGAFVSGSESAPYPIVGTISNITARKAAEETLRERDERYTALFDRSLDCVYIHDFEGNFIDANPAALKLFGYTKEEILSLNFASFLSQDQMSLALQTLEEIKKTGFQKDVAEFKVRKKNGEQIHIEVKSSLLYHEGEPYAIQGIGRDISNRKRSEEALRESEKRARQYLDIAGVAFVALDNEGNITLINQRGLEILGYRGEELLGKNWFKTCLPERMTDEVLDVYHQLIRGEVESVEYYENPVLTKDGKERIIAWHNSVLRNPDGENVGSLSSGEDITDRLLAEEALRTERDNLRNIFESIEDGIYIVNQQFDIQYVNPVLVKDFGSYEGGKCYEYFYDRNEVCPWCKNQDVWAGKTVRWEWYSFKNGRTYDLIDTPMTLQDGSIGKLEIFRDITDMKQAEEALRKSEAQLRALASRLTKVEEAERKRLARELHDRVGQNLTALNINLNIMKNRLSPQSAKNIETRLSDAMNLVEKTTERIRDVMADLRPEVLDDYGLMAALRWCGERFSNRTGIKTEIRGKELVPRLPPDAETALFRIVQEAMTNVAKHARAQCVTISFQEEADAVSRLTVVDDGVGFDSTARERAGKEHGWGLITMRERAQSLGGRLRVESEPGKGTRIVVEMM